MLTIAGGRVQPGMAPGGRLASASHQVCELDRWMVTRNPADDRPDCAIRRTSARAHAETRELHVEGRERGDFVQCLVSQDLLLVEQHVDGTDLV